MKNKFFLIIAVICLPIIWINALANEKTMSPWDFTLKSDAGAVSLSDFRGNVVLLYFGYTNCPDACPTTLSQWSKAFKKLTPQELAQVKGIMISVDPERDTPKRLALFVSFFHENIVGLTGSHEALNKATALFDTTYKVSTHKPGDKTYSVDHSFFVYLIDGNGKTRYKFDFSASVDDLVKLLRDTLAEIKNQG